MGAIRVRVGPVGATTDIVTGGCDVVTAPFESVTRAVNEAGPAEGGVHATEYGTALDVAMRVLPEKKSTLLTDAGATGVAVAARVRGEPKVALVPVDGDVSATDGAVTFTLTMLEVAVAPLESVTRAVIAKIPDAVGGQLIEYGAAKAVPIEVAPARKSTRPTVAPPLPDALAVIVAMVPKGIPVPLVGLVIETVGSAAATVTFTGEDVTIVPFESVTRAVRGKLPVVAGIQSAVYGLVVSVLTNIAPAKKSTFVTVAPPVPAAVAVMGTVVLTTNELPAAGVAIEIVGFVTEATTFTDTGVERTTLFLSSIV